MRVRRMFIVGVGMAALAAPLPAAQAASLGFAFQGDIRSLDPHTLNETFTLGFLGNIFEGLTRRGSDLEIEPALAESWELVEPTRWRFHLRRDVVFHNGNPFTADDVLFSYERAVSEGSDIGGKIPGVVAIEIVDDHTIDFVTETPNPILTAEFDTWYIMDREWSEEHNALVVTNLADQTQDIHVNLHANGTGPFKVVERVPDDVTRAVPNADWWDQPSHNLTEVSLRPIPNDATRVAALLSGDMDLVYPVPLQDVDRVEANDGTRALTGPELRTIFMGLDQVRDELLYSSVTGVNPFQDIRVRQAFNHAINRQAIGEIVMRGQSTAAASMVAPGINGFPEGLTPYAHDPEQSRALLAEAGYGDGFTLRLNCPNDRYVNDEAICQAVVGMLAQVGIEVELQAEPKSLFFATILAQGGYDTSFYLLGWTPGSLDSWNALFNLVATQDPDAGQGTFNVGGFSDARIDELVGMILVETDAEVRHGMIQEAWQILHDAHGYVPLHQQALSWGVRDGVDVVQRADNVFDWRHVTISE